MSDIDSLVAYLTSAPVVRVCAPNAVPESPTYPYAVVSLSFAAPGPATADGHKSTPKRLVVRVFAKSANAVEAWQSAIDGRLNGRALPLPGAPVAEFELAADVSRDPDDDGVLGVLMTYKF